MSKRIENAMVAVEAAKLFTCSGAFKQGHFVLSSGKHSDTYFNKRVISDDPRLLEETCRLLVELFEVDVEAIVSPEHGAIPFGKRVAELLSTKLGRQVSFVVAHKEPEGGFYIDDDDIPLVEDKVIGIVEDVFTTGRSTAKTVEAVFDVDGRTRIIVGLLERGGNEVRETLPTIPVGALMEIEATDYPEELCREIGLCAQGIEICTEPKIGHGEEYVDEHGQPPY